MGVGGASLLCVALLLYLCVFFSISLSLFYLFSPFLFFLKPFYLFSLILYIYIYFILCGKHEACNCKCGLVIAKGIYLYFSFFLSFIFFFNYYINFGVFVFAIYFSPTQICNFFIHGKKEKKYPVLANFFLLDLAYPFGFFSII